MPDPEDGKTKEVPGGIEDMDAGKAVDLLRLERERHSEFLDFIRFTQRLSTEMMSAASYPELYRMFVEKGNEPAGYRMMIFLLNEEKTRLGHIKVPRRRLLKRLGRDRPELKEVLKRYHIDLSKAPSYRRAVEGRETIYFESLLELMKEEMPPAVARLIARIEGMDLDSGCVLTPLRVREEIVGVLVVNSPAMYEEFIPSVESLSRGLSRVMERIGEEERRRELTNKLLQSEEKTRLITRNVVDVLWEMDLEERLTFLSPSFEKMTGYSLEEGLSMRMKDLLTPESYRIVSETLRQNLATDGGRRGKGYPPVTLEMEQRLKDGSCLWCEVTSRFVRDGRGRPVAVSGVTRDISRRREAEERLKILFESAPDAYYIADLKGNFVDGNLAAEKLVGYAREKLIGKNFLKLKLLSQDDIARAAANLARNVVGKPTGPDEFTIFRKDGGQVPVEIITHPVRIKDQRLVLGIARDISARKKAEVALRESQSRLKSIFLAAPVGIGLVSDRVFKQVNERLCEITGYQPGEILEKSARILYSDEEEFLRVGEFISGQMAQRGTGTMEARWKRKDGQVIDVLLNSTPLDPSNLSAGVAFTALDITERKRIEESLSESEARFRNFFENEPEYCYMVSPEGIILDVNKTAMEVLGYPREDLVGNPIRMIYAEECHSKVEELFDEWKKTGSLKDVQLTIRTREGVRRTVLLSSNSVKDRDGRIQYSLSVQRDITERQKTEEALEASERKFRSIIESIPIGMHMYRLEADGRLIFTGANPAADRILGVDNSRFVGLSIEEAFPALADTEIPGKYRLAAAEGEPWHTDQVVYEENEIAGAFLVDAFQTFPGSMAATFLDITDRRRMEEALKNLNEELEERVRERTEELERAHLQLIRQEKLAALGRIAGSVSHDLRNPLGVIANSVYYLRRRLSGEDQKVARHLDILQGQVRNATRIISELLDFSRTEPLDLRENRVKDLLKDTLGYLDIPDTISVETSLDNGLPPVKADPEQIRRVLTNLMGNALLAMPRGGTLSLGARRKGDDLVISIGDTGVGISEGDLREIFEPLYTTRERGIGLGLAIVKAIVEAHRGSVEVDSRVGEGSTFRVRLPLDGEA